MTTPSHLLPSEITTVLDLPGLTDNMMSAYDRDTTTEVLNWLALSVDNTDGMGGRGPNPARFKTTAALPRVFQAGGTMQLGSYLGRVLLEVPVDTFNTGESFNEDDLFPSPRPEVIDTLNKVSPLWGPAIANHRLGMVMSVIRHNPQLWDGRPLFSSAATPHSHPIPALGTFGNSVDLGTRFVDVLNPTDSEIVALMIEASQALSDQQTSVLAEARKESGRKIGIILHQAEHRSAFGRILNKGTYVNDAGYEVPLGLRDNFELITDPKGPHYSSGANIQIVFIDLDSPLKPVCLVIDAETRTVAEWRPTATANNQAFVGAKSTYGVRPLFAHPVWAARNNFGG